MSRQDSYSIISFVQAFIVISNKKYKTGYHCFHGYQSKMSNVISMLWPTAPGLLRMQGFQTFYTYSHDILCVCLSVSLSRAN